MKSFHVLLLAFALAWFSPSGALAGSSKARVIVNELQGIEYALPKNSPFKLSRKAPDGVTFEGRATISGRYVYGRNSPADEIGLPDPQPDLYFVPDAQSVALLPRWNWMDTVNGFYFTNGDAFLKAVIAPEIVKTIKSGKLRSVSGNLTIEIEGYFANVECGWPIYASKFLGIAQKSLQVASNKYADSISCSG